LLIILLLPKDVRLSENPVADPGQGGIPRFVLVARLAKVKMLNGSEVNHGVVHASSFCLTNLIQLM
jgi:hypothetical protein